MALGKPKPGYQSEMFVSTDAICSSADPYYRRLDQLLVESGFDAFLAEVCREFYHKTMGRPALPPGVYFQMLMIGYLEGLGSERRIAWSCNDSIALRTFLGYGITESTPDHSTLSKTRKRLSAELHKRVFNWLLRLLKAAGLLRGKTLGVDSTTVEANAAMRSIVRRDDGRSYEEYLGDLAKESGIETPTKEDLAKIDKKRKNKAYNKDWVHKGDPEARVAKMKDGRTHLAHKCEQAADMETEAVVAVTIQTTDGGDTASLPVTLDEATEQLSTMELVPEEVVADKAYHSNATMVDLKERKLHSYNSEPNRGCRRWTKNKEAQKPTYANRRRIRGTRGKALLRQRGEKVRPIVTNKVVRTL